MNYIVGEVTEEEQAEKIAKRYPEYLMCDACGEFALKPEHAHYKCTNCGARTSCCEGA